MIPLHFPRTLPIAELAAGTTLWRVHLRAHDPRHFDRSNRHRFNSPADEYGVCYLGDSLEVAFLETLIRGSRHRVVPKKELEARYGTPLIVRRSVQLFQFHSEGLVQIGYSADVPHREPYDECQQVALSVWREHAQVAGIEYRSRWNDRLLCVALFDRAADTLEVAGTPVPLDDLSQVRPILRRYDVGVV